MKLQPSNKECDFCHSDRIMRGREVYVFQTHVSGEIGSVQTLNLHLQCVGPQMESMPEPIQIVGIPAEEGDPDQLDIEDDADDE